tara:strand:- start:11 stop:481 length:471 start_codon:yes stop_codon:yes gene_type:complete
MNDIYLNIYNNLIKLTRNKNLYNNTKEDTFYDRMIILFFHLGFLLKIFKKIETKDNLQNFFDFTVRQIELSIREIGYGDATINKKMKDYVNLLFSIIDKIDKWEDLDSTSKMKIIKYFIEDNNFLDNYVKYFEKYIEFLRKNTFISLSKDILSLEN